MAMNTTFIEVAMAYNAANPSQSQVDASTRLANAIINTVKSMTMTYTTGLIAPSGGGPVTGVLTTVTVT